MTSEVQMIYDALLLRGWWYFEGVGLGRCINMLTGVWKRAYLGIVRRICRLER